MHGTVKIAKDHELFKAFPGIHEKILIGLYNLGALKNLASGDVLFREGERDHTIHLLLKGSLRLLKRTGSMVRQVALCHAGDVLCESLFFVPSGTLTAAVATQSCTVLSFSETLLETLDPSSSAFLTKKIVDTYQRRLQEQMAKQEALSAHCDFMIRFARRSIVERTQDYTQSEMIVGMLKKVPQLPMYASRLAHMLLDANVSAKDVAALAKNDPSLVSAVLKRVNSAYYNWQKKISDFQHAVILLGFNQVYQLVIADGLRRTMPNTPPFRALHNHSVVISHVAYEIAQLVDRQHASMLSTVALLHDIGKSVILLMKKQNPKLSVLIDRLDSAKLGALLLEEWNIPENVCRAVELQNSTIFSPPDQIPVDARLLVAILDVSHQCADAIRGASRENLWKPYNEEWLRVLNLRVKDVESLTRDHLRPSLEKKASALPEHVRQFLKGVHENGEADSEQVNTP
ncbi:MAG: HDOD domain-containing protein [Desulfosoma sp.]|uniref:HDOD domain-containing protein n=1 Tax=Desulfosoma sp. TaxID=2603217 RepID=UPI0040490EFE